MYIHTVICHCIVIISTAYLQIRHTLEFHYYFSFVIEAARWDGYKLRADTKAAVITSTSPLGAVVVLFPMLLMSVYLRAPDSP